ncbi:hypothetical protein ccbrp13_52140 [Ktedonobacteria bacterium brp13]|nr:hypothetical protein ccbrp13_52140 [Ktedonobacteria bacterium brp13]
MEALDTLVTAAQAGDLNAFSDIVQRFQGMAYVSAYTMLGDVQMAEDVAQEAFIEAYLHLPALHEPQAFPGWFRRISPLPKRFQRSLASISQSLKLSATSPPCYQVATIRYQITQSNLSGHSTRP